MPTIYFAVSTAPGSVSPPAFLYVIIGGIASEAVLWRPGVRAVRADARTIIEILTDQRARPWWRRWFR
jgi:hypothetical protein